LPKNDSCSAERCQERVLGFADYRPGGVWKNAAIFDSISFFEFSHMAEAFQPNPDPNG